MHLQPNTPRMPAAEPNGFVPTLNRQGYMTSTLDVFMTAFVEFSASSAVPVLDVGAAYGNASLPALARGASVIANDIDQRHLQILTERAPVAERSRLQTVCGAFPDELILGPESVGAILVARVAHFFDGPGLERAAQRAHEWLVPGGKIFLIAETPYLGNWRSFIPVYEERRAAGDRWPGYVDDVMKFAPDRGKLLPPTMLFLDPEVLRRTFSAVGFNIEAAQTFARLEFPPDMQLDGRESVGLIGVKL